MNDEQREWLKANGPGGWIDDLRRDNERLRGVLALIAAPLEINGPDHMADVTRARNALKATTVQPAPVRYGCHCDLENMPEGYEPDGCVIDDGMEDDCVYATQLVREGKGKTACKYWKPVTAIKSPPTAAQPDSAT